MEVVVLGLVVVVAGVVVVVVDVEVVVVDAVVVVDVEVVVVDVGVVVAGGPLVVVDWETVVSGPVAGIFRAITTATLSVAPPLQEILPPSTVLPVAVRSEKVPGWSWSLASSFSCPRTAKPAGRV